MASNLFYATANKQTAGYENYFNYEMNTRTWRNFVNKQFMQTYNRLVIEKQLKEAKKIEKELRDQLDETEKKIKQIDQEKKRLKEGNTSGGPNPSSSHGNQHHE